MKNVFLLDEYVFCPIQLVWMQRDMTYNKMKYVYSTYFIPIETVKLFISSIYILQKLCMADLNKITQIMTVGNTMAVFPATHPDIQPPNNPIARQLNDPISK